MTDTTVPDAVKREMLLAAPVERVWSALTDPAEIVKWFGDGAEVDLRPGGAITFGFGAQRAAAIVCEIEEHRRFAFYWVPGSASEDPVEITEDTRTLVDFTLEPVADGTRLRMVESGFARLGDARAYKDNSGGWDQELDELAAYLNAA